jgi:hypothetical protein
MKSRVLRQSVSDDSLFRVLAGWCADGAGKRNYRLRLLSAFASGGGVGAILPVIELFLADGNFVEVIVGIDRNGTDRRALRHLDSLIRSHPTQCSVGIFNAPAASCIFHPKLYVFDAPTYREFVIGSGNLTGGGLASNFESFIYYSKCSRTAAPSRHAEDIWTLFACPRPPLKKSYLRPLTSTYLRKLLPKLPKKAKNERSEHTIFRELWRPRSRIPFTGRTRPAPRPQRIRFTNTRRYLVMDVLTETRKTQMQVPVPVVEGFFGIPKRQLATFDVSIVTPTGFSQPVSRNLVRSQGTEGQRLMRRIEMPQIRNLDRPLVVVFIQRSGQRRYGFKLLPKNSRLFRRADALLDRDGQQGSARRRFLIGSPGDANWEVVRELLT